jgi:hypothetical protein
VATRLRKRGDLPSGAGCYRNEKRRAPGKVYALRRTVFCDFAAPVVMLSGSEHRASTTLRPTTTCIQVLDCRRSTARDRQLISGLPRPIRRVTAMCFTSCSNSRPWPTSEPVSPVEQARNAKNPKRVRPIPADVARMASSSPRVKRSTGRKRGSIKWRAIFANSRSGSSVTFSRLRVTMQRNVRCCTTSSSMSYCNAILKTVTDWHAMPGPAKLIG